MDTLPAPKLKPVRARPKSTQAVAVPSPVPLGGKPWMHGVRNGERPSLIWGLCYTEEASVPGRV